MDNNLSPERLSLTPCLINILLWLLIAFGLIGLIVLTSIG